MAESNTVQKIITGAYDYVGDWLTVGSPNHYHIHDGTFYTVSRSTTVLGASSWIDMEFVTMSSTTGYMHFKELYINNSAGLAQIDLYEATTNGSTHTNASSTLASINHNRNSTNTSNVVFGTGVTNLPSASTVTSTQYVLIYSDYAGSTGTNAVRGGFIIYRPENEVYLKANTTHVLRITNLSAAGYAQIKMFYYEVS